MRTRMASSGVLYLIGDNVAQFGIEEKSWIGKDEDESFDVSLTSLIQASVVGFRGSGMKKISGWSRTKRARWL